MARSIVSSEKLVADAMNQIETIDIDAAQKLLGSDDLVFVDIRDIRELAKGGKIPGAVHAPRGMLEFWIDPQSPYFREEFDTDKKLILYCAAGWRSALATKTLQDMGVEKIAHIGGGFNAWSEADGPVELKEKKPKSD